MCFQAVGNIYISLALQQRKLCFCHVFIDRFGRMPFFMDYFTKFRSLPLPHPPNLRSRNNFPRTE